MLSRLFLLLIMFTLIACSSTNDEPEYIERSVEEIYNQAFDSLKERNFRRAALEFDEVERQHPYSIWARRAMLMSAYSYYQQNKYSDAVLTARRFLALHPGNKNAPYPYYLIAQSYYEQISEHLCCTRPSPAWFKPIDLGNDLHVIKGWVHLWHCSTS